MGRSTSIYAEEQGREHMITSRELKLFEEKMQAEKCCLEQGGKILIGAVRRIRGLANLAENGIDDWSDYNAWDNWDRN